ncbi:DUF1049 domain-containing protein [Actinomycetospora sp. TBRC 11914]|uniref:DUF1049 domain-containing protein n=1 Tax=Actinomycetospora sp. TBRC 11914 TaxID=2729387 RepID=UPI001B7D4CFD|nr:DUF1049 domain-containing protein [Actinomycetospora sp. TBRC 11914]
MTAQDPRRPVAGAPSSAGRTNRWSPRAIVAVVLLVLAVVFVVENRDLTEIRLLIPIVLMPLWAALAITLIIGLVVGVVLGRRQK